ncbi:Gamma-secretase subunit Aph-1b [Nymphon striatum]|nr:Gamma-secretase subunit Aph-1b [Nymphon striatum]
MLFLLFCFSVLHVVAQISSAFSSPKLDTYFSSYFDGSGAIRKLFPCFDLAACIIVTLTFLQQSLNQSPSCTLRLSLNSISTQQSLKMTYMEFFGCAFIAFGPPLALFLITIARDPIRIIILISGAFFWLLSLLISSLLWYAVVPLRSQLAFGVVFSVIFQELFRFAFYKLLKRAESGLEKLTEAGGGNSHVAHNNKHVLAYAEDMIEHFQSALCLMWRTLLKQLRKKAPKPSCKSYSHISAAVMDKLMIANLEFFNFFAMCLQTSRTVYQTDRLITPFLSQDFSVMDFKKIVAGLGFGLMSGAFSFINVLADSVGPGTVGLHGSSQVFFITSALFTLCFVLLHTFWGVIFFQAADKNDFPKLILVFGSHMLISCLTLLNKQQMYFASLIPAYIIMLVCAAVAFISVGGTITNIKAFVMCKTTMVIQQ